MYPEEAIHRMDDATLENMIATYMATPQPIYSFVWQGGEPTLMGVEFYRKAVEIQKKYAPPQARITNAMQTNGTLITEEFAKFLGEHNFLVGVSLDGPEDLHDKYRLNRGDKGTHRQVLTGIELLEKYRVEFNILTLVNESNVKKPKEVYNYLKEQGFYFQQYIPCVEFDQDGKKLPYAISGQEWGQFLIGIFEEWKKEDSRKVSIRGFDSIISLLVLGQMNTCTMSGNCCHYFVVEHNGDVFPCDFFVQHERKLGNVNKDNFSKYVDSSTYHNFGKLKHQWNQECNKCEHLIYCSGDCLKHRIYNGNNPDNMSWLCDGWKLFYDATIDDFKSLCKGFIADQMPGHNGVLFDEVKPERNQECYCGSKKKYKFCHGRH